MVINKNSIVILCGLICLISLFTKDTYGAEQSLKLNFKTLAIEKIEDRPIGDLAISIVDIKNDSKNEIAVSGNGYLRIFEWNGRTFESRWKSPQYSHQLGPITRYKISTLTPVRFYSKKKLVTDYLYFAYTAPKASNIYRIRWKMNKYELQKIAKSPFNWFGSSGRCDNESSVIIGYKYHEKGNYVVVYKWKDGRLSEMWQGPLGADINASGEIFSSGNKIGNVFLVQDHTKTGIFMCKNDLIEWENVDKEPSKVDLWKDNKIGYGLSLIGSTRKNSAGELWSIQGSGNEYEYGAKLYMSQFDGDKFSPFSKVDFTGVDSNMIFNMIIEDIDNDGIGEILGVEEKIRKRIPRNNPADTGEEGDTLLITSNLFLAKWNGKEYEVKWHRNAVDERVRNIAVGDVTGDGKKEIVVIDDNGYFYVFEMPTEH